MDFSSKVLELTGRIPPGRVTTYGEIARALGSINLSRAVGNALNKNSRTIRIPCHRVVKSDASVGGYSRGTREKINLLTNEGIQIKGGRVLDFKKVFFRLSP